MIILKYHNTNLLCVATIVKKCDGKKMDKRGYNVHKRFCKICSGETVQSLGETAGDTKHTAAKQTALDKVQKFVEERTNPDKVVDALQQKPEQKLDKASTKQETVSPSQHNKPNKKGGGFWGWAAAGVGSLIVIGAGILLGGKKNV